MNDSEDKNIKYISLQEASKHCDYSPEYLRLLARQGKIFSKHIGRNWMTTKEAIEEYIAKQSLTIVIPKSMLAAQGRDRDKEGGQQIKLTSVNGNQNDNDNSVEDEKQATLKKENGKISSIAKEYLNTQKELSSQMQSLNSALGRLNSSQSQLADVNKPPPVLSERTEKILEKIYENLDKLSQFQAKQAQFQEQKKDIAPIVEIKTENVVPEEIKTALVSISENLKQLSQIQDVQLQQIKLQQEASESKLAEIPNLLGVEKIKNSIEK